MPVVALHRAPVVVATVCAILQLGVAQLIQCFSPVKLSVNTLGHPFTCCILFVLMCQSMPPYVSAPKQARPAKEPDTGLFAAFAFLFKAVYGWYITLGGGSLGGGAGQGGLQHGPRGCTEQDEPKHILEPPWLNGLRRPSKSRTWFQLKHA
jgi:hypothetical protein